VHLPSRSCRKEPSRQSVRSGLMNPKKVIR